MKQIFLGIAIFMLLGATVIAAASYKMHCYPPSSAKYQDGDFDPQRSNIWKYRNNVRLPFAFAYFDYTREYISSDISFTRGFDRTNIENAIIINLFGCDLIVPTGIHWGGLVLQMGLLFFVSLSAHFAFIRYRKMIRKRRNHCLNCNYPLPPNSLCPECGSDSDSAYSSGS